MIVNNYKKIEILSLYMLLNKLLHHRNSTGTAQAQEGDMDHSPSQLEFIRARNTLLRNPYRLDACQYAHCMRVIHPELVTQSVESRPVESRPVEPRLVEPPPVDPRPVKTGLAAKHDALIKAHRMRVSQQVVKQPVVKPPVIKRQNDGSIIAYFEDGTQIAYYADGTYIRYNTDGSRDHYTPSNGKFFRIRYAGWFRRPV